MEQEIISRVTPISAPSEVAALREQCKAALERRKICFRVCAGTACIAGGSLDVYEELKKQIQKRGINVDVELLYEGGETDVIVGIRRPLEAIEEMWPGSGNS